MPIQPCEKCGGRFPGFHICLGRSDEEMNKVEYSDEQIQKAEVNRFSGKKHTEASKRRIAAAVASRHAANREKVLARTERNRKIIDRYAKGDIGMKGVAKELGTTYTVVAYVLRDAAERGEVTIRPKGSTVGRWDRYHSQNKELCDEIVKEYKLGYASVQDLATKHGMSPDTVRSILKAAQNRGEVRMRAKNERPKFSYEHKYGEKYHSIIERYKTSKISMDAIAAENDMVRHTVRAILLEGHAKGQVVYKGAK